MRNTLILLACLFTLSLSAQEKAMTPKAAMDVKEEMTTGMHFVEKSFDDLLAQAKAEDKVIFIDAYTTWCGPCKMMAKNVFPAEEVGAVYNERFINAKFDMEKGEGPALAKRYSVMAYPTYLFVDGNGDIVHKGVGYIPQEAFLELADAATGDKTLGALNKRYDAGERGEEFLRDYAEVLTTVYEQEKAGKVVGEYLDQLDDWSDESTLEMLVQNPGEVGGKRMNYIIENADAAVKLTEGSLVGMLQESIINGQMKASGERKLPDHATMNAIYTEHTGSLAPQLTAHYKMLHARYSRDSDNYLPAAVAYYGEYGSNNPMELNSIAWDIYESSEDEQLLKKGIGFAKKSVELEAGYPNLDTLAWLYEKAGDHAMAVKTAQRAIEMAKKSGEDYAATQKIIDME